ncbi:hypothetical protein GUITHDRAFT_111006 [Guillardia theta CCMP2712]|uniref:Uncharacterized protein n=1 Tax=Guillardia theta (strain CCMP2712) TaxID=905079 RepID=L1J357_GUITC|nr:hypothetical protein GUITHDRAFT_111006 [Guillardia theta CCMP2712]EKX42958.1 hypothetical protein GUITHDRAFT_111006 [Guillardia theta CCMP2712]|eukprot:XP_005829938.1 hypothetical protein GUITHDRAFT_111006 [Guillardia theta CCMP2712]
MPAQSPERGRAGAAFPDSADSQGTASMSRWEHQIASLRQASSATILALEERLKGLQNQLAYEEQTRKKWSEHANDLQKQLHRARRDASELIVQQRKAIMYLTEDRTRLHSLISDMQKENRALRQQVRAYMSQAVGEQEAVTGCITWMVDGDSGGRDATAIPLIHSRYVDQTAKDESRWLEGRLWKTPPANAFGDFISIEEDSPNNSFFTPSSSPRIEGAVPEKMVEGRSESNESESADPSSLPPGAQALHANFSPDQCRTGFSNSSSPEDW